MATSHDWKTKVVDLFSAGGSQVLNTEITQSISSAISSKELELLELIEHLGEQLTSTDKNTRGLACQLIAEVLHRLPYDFLSQKQVKVLVQFFSDRLKDHHLITPHAVTGLAALSQMQSLTDDDAILIINSIFKEVHVQTLQQSGRQNVYVLLARFLDNRLPALKDLGSEFVHGFIQTMDAEKDPRNLVICFKMMPIVAKQFPIDVFVEDLFEVVACYFPVDFEPPKDDPFGVKKDDLVHGLRTCLSANAKFAEFCLPLLIEKLTASVDSAKVDSLLTLAACAKVYASMDFKEYLPSLLFNVRREIFSSGNPEVVEAAHAALFAIGQLVQGQNDETPSTQLLKLAEDVFKEVNRYLCETESGLMFPSASMLATLASSSIPACHLVIGKTIPLLVEHYQTNTESSIRAKLLDVILILFKVSASKINNVNVDWKEKLLSLVLSQLSCSEARLSCKCLEVLACFQALGCLLEKEHVLLLDNILSQLLSTPSKDIRDSAGKSLVQCSHGSAALIKSRILPQLFAALKEDWRETGQGDSKKSEEKADINVYLIKLCSELATEPTLTSNIAPVMLDLVEKGLHGELHEDKTKEALRTLQSCVQHLPVDSLESDVVKPLLKVLVLTALSSNPPGQDTLSADVIQEAATICRFVHLQNKNHSSSLCNLFLEVFWRGNVDILGIKSSGQERFTPFNVDQQRSSSLLSLFSNFYCSLHCDVKVQEDLDIFKKCWALVIEKVDNPSRMSCVKCVACIINKMNGDVLEKELPPQVAELKTAILEDRNGLKAFELWVWISKALLLRGHTSQQDMLNFIISQLSNTKYGVKAAEAFQTIHQEYEDCLSSVTRAHVTMMYHQRFFHLTINQLLAGFSESQPESKKNYLLAVSHHLRYIPQNILQSELQKLLPLLVEGLCLEDVEVKRTALASLADVLTSNVESLIPYTDDIVPHLIKLTEVKDNLLIRSDAAQCIGLLTALPSPLITRHRPIVLRALAKLLDDHKRLVRKAAVEARMKWFLLETKS